MKQERFGKENNVPQSIFVVKVYMMVVFECHSDMEKNYRVATGSYCPVYSNYMCYLQQLYILLTADIYPTCSNYISNLQQLYV